MVCTCVCPRRSQRLPCWAGAQALRLHQRREKFTVSLSLLVWRRATNSSRSSRRRRLLVRIDCRSGGSGTASAALRGSTRNARRPAVRSLLPRTISPPTHSSDAGGAELDSAHSKPSRGGGGGVSAGLGRRWVAQNSNSRRRQKRTRRQEIDTRY